VNDTDWLRKAFRVPRRPGCLILLGVLLGVLVGSVTAFFLTGFFPLFSLVTLVFIGLALSTTYARLR